MISRTLRLVCFLSVSIFAASPSLAQDAPLKIGVVNLDVVLSESTPGKELQARLEEFRLNTITESEEIEAKILAIKVEVEKGLGTLPAATVQSLKKQANDAAAKLQQFREEKQLEGQKLRVDGLNDFEKKLQPVFSDLQSENGYDLILSNRTGVVLWAGERVDITLIVLERMN